ncbi:DUF2381 family protein [Pyxidicoccus parkwayensis]|jgi:uncharacterized protein (TIGR02268 family)|uniref:DUF2381 family protein n=1 Tax=Pyxidicoccus parkwayensis TaxID=2813578 RepID=A0ABX7P260_9BACT|nr:DUF2381 family protein [Pyxidicoccus parkwaysis]QSQ24394.1 DUF2381 family protein [Pyxidicoccus parkwaysis]
MPASFLVLLLPVLLSGPVSAEPAFKPCQTGVHHVELPVTVPEEPVQVCISPGQTTIINFDGALVSGSLSLEGADRFTLAEPGLSTLKLVPSEKLAVGERLRLTVRFQDAAAPTSAALLLVVHPAQATPLVDVHRQSRTVESFRQELGARDAQLRQCQEENTRLRAESTSAHGLAGLQALGLLRIDTPFEARDNSKSAKGSPASALLLGGIVRSFRAAERVAVTMSLRNPEGAAAWTAQGAKIVLEDKRGVELKVLEVWPREPIPPGRTLKLVVEAEAPDVNAKGPFTLRLWEAEGGRTAIVQGVMLP